MRENQNEQSNQLVSLPHDIDGLNNYNHSFKNRTGLAGSIGPTVNRYVYRFGYHKNWKYEKKNKKNLENCGSTRKPENRNG